MIECSDTDIDQNFSCSEGEDSKPKGQNTDILGTVKCAIGIYLMKVSYNQHICETWKIVRECS